MPSITADSAPGSRLAELPAVHGVDKPASPLTDSDIDKIVERKLGSNDFRVLRWSLDKLNETNGFLGTYYSLTATVRAAGDDKSRVLKFFAKTPPPSTSLQYDFLITSNTFNKEIAIYEDLVPRLGKKTGGLKWIPDFYLGKNNTIIVLEDGEDSGYVMPDKYLSFDEEQCIWVVKALSTFHSRSLILDEKLSRGTGQTIHDIYGHLLVEQALDESNFQCQKYLKSSTVGAQAMVDLVEGLTDDERKRVKDRLGRWMMLMPRLVNLPSKYRNVLSHRDIWANNIMLRREPSSGKLTGCYLIDFQFMRLHPPAFDFLLNLYLNTNRATRNAHFKALVDLYCDTMSAELASEGLDMEECLSRAEFAESCKELASVTMVYSITNLQIMLLHKDAVEKYFVGSIEELDEVIYGDRRAELVLGQCRNVKFYQTRMIEILEEIKEHLPDNPPNC